MSNAPIAFSSANVIRCQVQGTSIDVAWTLSAPPRILDGVGWVSEARPGRRHIVYWDGAPAWKLALPVIFHAGPTAARLAYVQRQWDSVRALMESPAGGGQPRLATLTGALMYQGGEDWCLAEPPAEDDSQFTEDGRLQWWLGRLTVVKLTARETLTVRGVPGPKHRTHVVKRGETLAQIAASEKVSLSLITLQGGKKIADPKRIKEGTVLWLPLRGSNPADIARSVGQVVVQGAAAAEAAAGAFR